MRLLLAKRIYHTATAVSQAWFRYECGSLAASVAVYSALSLFPLMMVLVAGVGIFFEFVSGGQDAKAAVLEFFSDQVSPEFSQGLVEVFSGVQSGALLNGPLAALGFFITASLAFAQVVRGFDRIWEVRQGRKRGLWSSAGKFAIDRLWSLAMVAGMGALVVFAFFGGMAVYTAKEFVEHFVPEIGRVWGTRSYLLSLAGTTLGYGSIYYFLSRRRASWKVCLASGLLAGLLWELGRGLLGQFVIGQRFSAYGLVGSFLTILLWIYYAAMVLFVGALLVRVLTDERRAEGG
jgi:membrane protein